MIKHWAFPYVQLKEPETKEELAIANRFLEWNRKRSEEFLMQEKPGESRVVYQIAEVFIIVGQSNK